MLISDMMHQILSNLPAKPGCYLMKNRDGVVIYVGKAVNLRGRVRSYFHTARDHGVKKRELVRRIADIEWIIQESEIEAILLEYNLINRYRPKYNVRWKDDKHYPYIKVHWTDPFPSVSIARKMQDDGSRYFGPYTSLWAVHQTLSVLRKIFRYLSCDRVITGLDQRACLYWDIDLCTAPCIGRCDEEEYRAMIDDLCRFLDGNTKPVVSRLTSEMRRASSDLRFEQAATRRDQLVAINQIVAKQKVINVRQTNADVIAFDRDADNACVQVFFVRDGKLLGRDHFMLEGVTGEEGDTILSAFLKQFYHKATYIPPEVLLPHEAAEAQTIEKWLRDRRGGQRVFLNVPQRGTKRDLVRMATENAGEMLASVLAREKNESNVNKNAITELQEALKLPTPPNRIECYDISNTQGTYATGSMVVFERGKRIKSHYRRFTIQTVSGPDDYSCIREVLTRRFHRWNRGEQLASSKGNAKTKGDESFSHLPDLVIVDGGKGQLGAATEVMAQFGITKQVSIAALAKSEQYDKLFQPGQNTPILFPRRSQALFLLQRIRDEAHRFALSHHRMLRGRGGLSSQLEAVPGIGPSRRKALLKRFGSLKTIRAASLEDLLQVRGMSRTVAQALKETL